MSAIQIQDLLQAGMHFGHLTRRWNPKMKPYIYGVRQGIHIIDLSKTAKHFEKALQFVEKTVGDGQDVLFVGTKRQAQDLIREAAERCKMFYINQRWLGGTLTNFRTIKASIDRLKNLQKKKEDGTFATISKKEMLMVDREIEKLLHSLGGIQNMTKMPGVIVMVDSVQEHIALCEADVLKIPVVALADTNCDPDLVEFLVPGNDDALRSIQLFLDKIADKVLEGLQLREINARRLGEDRREKREEGKGQVREVEITGAASTPATYVARTKDVSEAGEEAAEGQYSVKPEGE